MCVCVCVCVCVRVTDLLYFCCYYYCHDSRFISVLLLVLKYTATDGFLVVILLSVTCLNTRCTDLHALCFIALR